MGDGVKIRAGLDYLTVSKVQDERSQETILYNAQAFEATRERIDWKHGYSGVKICGGNGQVLSRPSLDGIRNDVLVRLPGSAIQWIRDRNLLSDGPYDTHDAEICRFFTEQEGFHATRIDLAVDTNDSEVTLPVVEAAVKARMFTGRAKQAGNLDTWKIDDPESRGRGQTVTLGGRTSSRYMRIYNKQAQVLKELGRDIGHMIRFELEIKGEAANKTLHLMQRYGADAIPGLLAGWVNFKDPADDEPRMDRKRNISWWEKIVNGAEPVILGLSRSPSTPERSTKWLKHGVAKTLALALDHGLLPEIKAAIVSKRHRIKPAEQLLWDNYEAQRAQRKTLDSTYTEGAADAK